MSQSRYNWHTCHTESIGLPVIVISVALLTVGYNGNFERLEDAVAALNAAWTVAWTHMYVPNGILQFVLHDRWSRWTGLVLYRKGRYVNLTFLHSCKKALP